MTSWWKKFGVLNVPNTVNSFCWRAYHEALTTVVGLFRRKIIISACYFLCQSAGESVGHVLLLCKYAKAIWRLSDLMIRFKNLFHSPFKEVLHLVEGQPSQQQFQLFLCLQHGVFGVKELREFMVQRQELPLRSMNGLQVTSRNSTLLKLRKALELYYLLVVELM